MAAITFTDYSDDQILLTEADQQSELYINKTGASFTANGDNVIVRFYDYANTGERKMIKVDYNDVVSPASAGATDLANKLKVIGKSALKASGQHLRIWDFLLMG